MVKHVRQSLPGTKTGKDLTPEGEFLEAELAKKIERILILSSPERMVIAVWMMCLAGDANNAPRAAAEILGCSRNWVATCIRKWNAL